MRSERLADLLSDSQRVAIVGGPRTGKTTLSEKANEIPVIHGDDFIDLGWSESSAKLAEVVNESEGKLIVEGVQIPRAIRKGMVVDAMLILEKAYEELTEGQSRMTKAVHTVLEDCYKQGLLGDVNIVYGDHAE